MKVRHFNFCVTLYFVNNNPVPHWGGGGGGEADSTRYQIVFFITSVGDAAEPRNLMTFPKI